MEYHPVHPDAIEAARKKLEEAENALNALLDQQHGFECQNNPLLDMIRKGTVFQHRMAGGFFIDGKELDVEDPMYEHAFQLYDLDAPQIEWVSWLDDDDWVSVPMDELDEVIETAHLVNPE